MQMKTRKTVAQKTCEKQTHLNTPNGAMEDRVLPDHPVNWAKAPYHLLQDELLYLHFGDVM